MASSANVKALLSKTSHYDKDERYMATTDLCEVLKKQDFDVSTEKEICKVVLTLLHDPSHDVQAVAVKTLSVLLTTVQQEQVLEIADSLTDQVLDAKKGELRDVYAIGLRTLVKTTPTTAVANRLLGPGRLLEGIQNGNEEIALACLDILCDLLTYNTVSRQHEAVLHLCLAQLNSQSPVIRKRAGNAIACLSTVLTDPLLQRMVEALLQQMDETSDRQTLIRTLCAVAGAVGHRLGQAQIDRILPIFLKFTNPAEATTEDHEEMDDNLNELRESCFMGFESFVSRCPIEVEPHLDSIILAALAYMSYDPNYSYDNEEEEAEEKEDAEEMDEEEDEEYEQEVENDDDEEDDEDDESWKVRRSAIRALKAVVETKQHNPIILWNQLYNGVPVSQALVARFKEREENCRIGILDCFTFLLEVTIQASSKVGMLQESVDLKQYTHSLVKACMRILSTKKGNDRSKSMALNLLATLCQAPGGIGGSAEISGIFRHVQALLRDSEGTSKALRLDSLSLTKNVLASDNHDPKDICASLETTLLPQLCEAVQEQWYKLIAEALRALAQVPLFFPDSASVCDQLVNAVEPLLAAHDVDQEIKECALKAAGNLLVFCKVREDQSSRLLQLLLERLKNETTRIAAIKTLSFVGACDLSPILAEAVQAMGNFLQLSSRSLKQSSLEALDIVVTNHGAKLNVELFDSVLKELGNLITDRDLHLSHLSLRVAVSILRACPAAGPAVQNHVLEPALVLSTSSLLQDHALESLLALFQQMIVGNAIDFNELLKVLKQRLTDHVAKHGIYNLAKCVAVITTSTTPANQKAELNDIFKLLDGSKTPSDTSKVHRVQLALLITGDIGREMDLSAQRGVADRLKGIYLGYFDSWSDEIKNAASYALGNAAVGAPKAFLQAMVNKLEEDNKKQQYLLLSALREFIQSTRNNVEDSVSVIVPPLELHCADEEEGVRTMVAECFGSLACLQPKPALSKLAELQMSHSTMVTSKGAVAEEDTASKKNAHVCWTVATSVKHAIAGKVDVTELSQYMPTFVKLLSQDEVSVRNAALLMVYSAVHHMPQVVAGLLKDSIMPSLYEVAGLKLERKVDLGPFTHTVDDALPLRKAALSIFATCLENLPGNLDISEFMPVLAKSLGDAEDIQLHAHQIVISMCSRQPTYVVASVETFIEPLEKTMNKKHGQKTGTELERLNDWIKSALRVMLTLSKLEGAMNSRNFAEFVERIKGNSKFSPLLAAMEEEM